MLAADKASITLSKGSSKRVARIDTHILGDRDDTRNFCDKFFYRVMGLFRCIRGGKEDVKREARGGVRDIHRVLWWVAQSIHNLVAFHYGNLTHPSVDPPRIGFLSLVPQNISEVFAQAVQDARNSGGNFESPTATAGVPVTTVSPSTPAFITDLSALTTLRLAVPSATR
ncbi:hypothetical protein ONZ45_g8163 [Pleurotus djamor]|nr:hypothetical protein ONZ45_g8163 [Pleurotus djamor]